MNNGHAELVHMQPGDSSDERSLVDQMSLHSACIALLGKLLIISDRAATPSKVCGFFNLPHHRRLNRDED